MEDSSEPRTLQEHDSLLGSKGRKGASYFHLPSWLYPFKGIIFFISHPFMYPLFRASLLPCILLSIVVLFNLFLFAYLPQVAFLAIFQGWSAWLNGTILVLGEGAAIVAVLYECFFADETQVDIFDAILISKGHERLVLTSRDVSPQYNSNNDDINADTDTNDHTNNDIGDNSHGINESKTPVQRLNPPRHHTIYAPFSFRQIFEFVIFLPLNIIPYIGVPLFLLLTGYRAGPLLHWRYFALKGMSAGERKAFVKERRWSYTWFGVSALMLQLVPVLSIFFLLTTAAGSALWAARLENLAAQRETEVEVHSRSRSRSGTVSRLPAEEV